MPETAIVHPLHSAAVYQPRDELARVEAWWREGRGGLCALVGLGGAGKTAIAERFVGGLAAGGVRGAFVYSFYEEPFAEVFFEKLAAWLGGRSADVSSHFAVIEALSRSEERVLLVLDGLERVQNAAGEIEDVLLADLVSRAADGALERVAILVTTRVAIAGVEHARVNIGALDQAAAVALLRARGVAGSDEELRAVASDCGGHALCLDLTASHIAELGPVLAEDELDAAVLGEISAEKRELISLERRLSRIARSFRAKLDREARRLMELACAFRNGVTDETLALVRGLEDPRGIEEGVQALDRLAKLGLIDHRGDRVLVHPAIRDAFVTDDPLQVAAHKRAAFALLAGTNLQTTPRAYVIAKEADELIHHLVASGASTEAWSYYARRMGGFLELGTKRAAYARGEGLCRLIAGDGEPKLIPLERAAFFNEHGLYLHRLGRLDAAIACFRKAADLAAPLRRESAGIALQNLADAEALRGRLPAARATMIAATAMFLRADDEPETRPEERFHRENRREILPHLIELGGGGPDDATIDPERRIALALAGATEYAHGTSSAYHALLALDSATLARERGDLTAAREPLAFAHAWARDHGERELLARSYLETARMEVRESNAEKCRTALYEGIRLATDSGYELILIDLLLVRGELESSRRDLEDALARASHPDCKYASGERRARELLRQSNL